MKKLFFILSCLGVFFGLNAQFFNQELDRLAVTQAQLPIIDLNQDNIGDLISSSKPVIIDVYADWCGPCQRFAPIFHELHEEYGQLYQFAKLNAVEQPTLLDTFHITALPTIILIKNGIEIDRQVGFREKNDLINHIQKAFAD